MTDTKFRMRNAQAGGFVNGAPGDVLTFQADGSLQGEPLPPPPVGAEPEGNIYWLDPNFAGTSNGSIAAPFTTFAEFWAVVLAGGANENFALMLPAPGVAIDSPMPDLGAGFKNISFVGKGKEVTRMGNFVALPQSGVHSLYFYDCHFDSWTFASGIVDIFTQNVAVNDVTVTAGLIGTITAVGSTFINPRFPFNTYSVVMYGGVLQVTAPGQGTWNNGEFHDVQFLTDAISPHGLQKFFNCQGLPGVTNDHAPTLQLDPVTLQSYIDGGGTIPFPFIAAVSYHPNVPRIAALVGAGGETIAPGANITVNFGATNPKTEPGSPVVGSWHGDPGDPGIVLERVWSDPASGLISAVIGNTSAAPVTVADPLRLAVTYLTRFSP